MFTKAIIVKILLVITFITFIVETESKKIIATDSTYEWVCINNTEYCPIRCNCTASFDNGLLLLQGLELDSTGNPHILWIDDKNNNLVYINWDGEEWLTIDGEIYNQYTRNAILEFTKGAESATLKLDSRDNPHIVWCGFIDEPPNVNVKSWIQYARWNSYEWLSPNNKSYNEKDSLIIPNSNSDSFNPCLEIDSNNHPHIVWKYGRYVVYVKHNGNNWLCPDGEIVNDFFIEFGTGVQAGICFSNITFGMEEIYEPSFSLDSADKPHIVWSGLVNVDHEGKTDLEIFYVNWGGSNWVNALGQVFKPSLGNASVSCNYSDSVFSSCQPQVTIDKSDKPHIVWCDGTSPTAKINDSDIFYVRWDGKRWVCANGEEYSGNNSKIATVSETGMGIEGYFNDGVPRIQLDSNGVPYVSWIKCWFGAECIINTYSDLQLVKWDGSNWVSLNGAKFSESPGLALIGYTDGEVADSSYDLCIDKIDNPHIAWSFNPKDTWGDDNEIIYIRAIDSNSNKISPCDNSIDTEENENILYMWIDNNKYMLNGTYYTMDVAPRIINSSTFVPLRFIGEALNCTIHWDNNEKKVTYVYTDNCEGIRTILELWIGKISAMKNNLNWTLIEKPVIVNNRTLVPLRSISEALNANVEWDHKEKKITIKHPYD